MFNIYIVYLYLIEFLIYINFFSKNKISNIKYYLFIIYIFDLYLIKISILIIK